MKWTAKTKLFFVVILVLPGTSANAALEAYFPLNDGAVGTLATGVDDVIDDPSHPITDATRSGAGTTDSWVINTVAHPSFDPCPGAKIVDSTGELSRMRAGKQGIDLTVGFSWSLWVNVASSNISDTGADVIIGTRSGNGSANSTGAWHKVDLSGASAWNGNLAYAPSSSKNKGPKSVNISHYDDHQKSKTKKVDFRRRYQPAPYRSSRENMDQCRRLSNIRRRAQFL